MHVLDLFCGEGGASAGYNQAGLTTTGADLDPRAVKRYPYDGHVLDWKVALDKFAVSADLIHASPPCQRYSSSTPFHARGSHPDLVAEVREALKATGKPYVIENVLRAPLEKPVELCGCMFRLECIWRPDGPRVRALDTITPTMTYRCMGNVHFRLERRRGFEVSGFSVAQPEHDEWFHQLPVMTVVGGTGTPSRFRNTWLANTTKAAREEVMGGVHWMSGHGLAESIPPAYSKYIGEAFLK